MLASRVPRLSVLFFLIFILHAGLARARAAVLLRRIYKDRETDRGSSDASDAQAVSIIFYPHSVRLSRGEKDCDRVRMMAGMIKCDRYY